MLKVTVSFISALTVFLGIGIDHFFEDPKPKFANPPELTITQFAGPDITPSPACLAVAATGEVFVGVDMMGSLGKAPGKGRIVKLIDSDNDGKLDKHTEFAVVDNPRGIIANGTKVFVLHTTFSKETGTATGMDLVVFEDKNNDGVADGPEQPLIQNFSNTKYLQERGTDHATNGIRMGIDGWIYVGVGDFGFHNAIDRSGKKMTMLGGGIVRVRPDGTGMEVYTHGTRNVYDVAIDPFMNIFTRENTNDGGGWNIRFSHSIQSGEYGYPLLFQHFTDEIIPALVDVGGGSGTGSLYFDEPNWPAKYTKVPMMADWGNNMLYIHRVTPDGSTFTQKDEDFINLPQITDLDVDGSGRLYLSAWDGAGYNGSPSKGYVVRAVPNNWKYTAFPELAKLSEKELGDLLKAPSAVTRLNASQELLRRPARSAANVALAIATNKDLTLESRVAGLYTYSQAAGESGIPALTTLTREATMREFALRALADRKEWKAKVPIAPFLAGLNDVNPRVQAAATIGLGRLGNAAAIPALLKTKVPASFAAPAKSVAEGPHATPNSPIILPHLAVRALLALKATDACIAAIGTQNSTLGLWALRYMHNIKAVNGLIAAYKRTANPKLKKEILTTVSRLFREEAPYDASWWWGTRPDAPGPYYKADLWAGSPAIETFLKGEWKKANASGKEYLTYLNIRHRMGITEFGGEEEKPLASNEPKIDLEKIKNKKGQVGIASIEDVMLAISNLEGDPVKGKALFTQQGCISCHTSDRSEKPKGPFMGQIGSIMTREQIAESILKPNASISQGFATYIITAKGDKTYMGFVTSESADRLIMRDITGTVFTVKTSDIISRKEMGTSMMPAGLANSLSYQEMASLVTFLSQQKK